MPVTSIDVWDRGGVYAAKRAVREPAAALGMNETVVEELVLVVHELATNLVKHADGGTIRIRTLDEPERRGLQIQSVDSGAGIADAEQALEDGVSTTGTPGYGLGTVHRLMDDMQISSREAPESGLLITCTRWLEQSVAKVDCPFEFGVVTRPHPKMAVNGDAFILKRGGTRALVAVIDGLGHGQFAMRAARSAREYIERHHEQPLEPLVLGINRACRATRGVVLALARLDWTAETLQFASIGNIEARAHGVGERISLPLRRGVVGMRAPTPHVVEHRWLPSHILVLHSDGLSTRWSWSDFPGISDLSAAATARRLFRSLAKPDDDATVLVVKGRVPTQNRT